MATTIVLHGEDVVSSRQELEKIKQKTDKQGYSAVHLEGRDFQPQNLVVGLEPDLFVEKKLVILDSFEKLTNQEKKQAIQIIQQNAGQNRLVIWSAKKINKRLLNKLPDPEVRRFKPKAIIFKFLDSLHPKKKTKSLRLLNKLLAEESSGLVFYMLTQRVENLIIAHSGHTNLINHRAGWQRKRLVQQARPFSQQQLKKLLAELIRLDYYHKTGRLNYSFEFGLELLIATI